MEWGLDVGHVNSFTNKAYIQHRQKYLPGHNRVVKEAALLGLQSQREKFESWQEQLEQPINLVM